MRAPVAWTAYVDKNQVVWTESDKNFKIEVGKGLLLLLAWRILVRYLILISIICLLGLLQTQ
jgi:hypothetical protein